MSLQPPKLVLIPKGSPETSGERKVWGGKGAEQPSPRPTPPPPRKGASLSKTVAAGLQKQDCLGKKPEKARKALQTHSPIPQVTDGQTETQRGGDGAEAARTRARPGRSVSCPSACTRRCTGQAICPDNKGLGSLGFLTDVLLDPQPSR